MEGGKKKFKKKNERLFFNKNKKKKILSEVGEKKKKKKRKEKQYACAYIYKCKCKVHIPISLFPGYLESKESPAVQNDAGAVLGVVNGDAKGLVVDPGLEAVGGMGGVGAGEGHRHLRVDRAVAVRVVDKRGVVEGKGRPGRRCDPVIRARRGGAVRGEKKWGETAAGKVGNESRRVSAFSCMFFNIENIYIYNFKKK